MTKDCAQCGTSFYVRSSHYDKKVYCGMKCMAEGYKVRMKGKSNPHYKNAGWHICETCKAKFHRYNKASRFCSYSCAGKRPEQIAMLANIGPRFKIGNIEWKKRKTIRKTTKICSGCGNEFAITRKTRQNKYCKTCCPKGNGQMSTVCVVCGQSFITAKCQIRKACSPECRREWDSIRQRGEKSHLWRGGKTSAIMILRGSLEYSRWRTAVFERDDFTCYATKARGGKLTAHHILPVSECPELIFDVDNGITLAWEYHSSIRWKEAEYVAEFQDAIRKRKGG